MAKLFVAFILLFNAGISQASASATATRGQSVAFQVLEMAMNAPEKRSITMLAQLARKVGTGAQSKEEEDEDASMNKAWEAALADDEEVSAQDPEKLQKLAGQATVDQAFESELGSIEANVSPKDVESAITQMSEPPMGKPAVEEQMPEGQIPEGKLATESMDKAITELVMGKSSFAGTPMGGSITKIKDLIVKTMMPAVLDAHKTDQHELDKLVMMLRRCTKAKNVGFREVKKFKGLYLKHSPAHKKCRADEAVKYTTQKNCHAEQYEKREVKMLKCQFFASASRRIGDSNANAQIVKKGGSEAIETYARRITSTICGKTGGKGKGGNGQGGFLDQFLLAKAACQKATKEYNAQVKKCRLELRRYRDNKKKCNAIQSMMDGAACKRAVLVKDECEKYAECHASKLETFKTARKTVIQEEKDRKAEWRGLKRMACLINAFADGKVEDKEVDSCKKKAHSTKHLIIKYPKVPKFESCKVPDRYPSTAAYKKAEFASLPAIAKGKESQECTGVMEISTTPKAGSPKSCKCERVTMNGPYSAGPMVKCTKCHDARRSAQKNSCPDGTKIFSPASRTDWQTFIKSAGPLRHPHFIIDVTRPQNGCGGCTKNPMNSGNRHQKTWRTADNSAWWLRSTRYSEPNGDYHANCYLDLWHTPKNPNAITWNDGSCNYHSKSYYCQPSKFSTRPAPGSPSSCNCKKVELAGVYSTKLLLKCEQCLTVHRSTQKNSCPSGMKIFSPASRRDWKTFIRSAGPLRAPHWIIDVTRPSNGCGGCTRHAMNSKVANQMTWKTSDGSAWWLRSSRYSEPNGDYSANCFLDLWRTPSNENSVTFNDGRCNYRSKSYYCQPKKKKGKR